MKHCVKKIGKAEIIVWNLTESVEELKQQLTVYNEEEFSKLNTDKRKSEYLAVRVALKALLGKEIMIEYNQEGKPFLSDGSFQISISHSKNWIAVIVHPTRQVGIDIECPTDKIRKIYSRFLSEDEQTDLSNGENSDQLQLAWSAKEALYKIIGNDAVDFANQLRIYAFEVKTSGKIEGEHLPSKKIYHLKYNHNSDYTLVYCLD